MVVFDNQAGSLQKKDSIQIPMQFQNQLSKTIEVVYAQWNFDNWSPLSILSVITNTDCTKRSLRSWRELTAYEFY